MAFSGKATYTAGAALPELAEDVSDVISIVSPFETPLLDALGDPLRAAISTHYEWLEDELLPNKDAVNDSTIADPETETQFDVAHGDRFRAGDQIQCEGSTELMLVTAVAGDTLTVIREYAGTAADELTNGDVINILGNAALEGGDRPAANPQGSGTVRRTMKGIVAHLVSNVFSVGDAGFPSGIELDEEKLNYTLRRIWENSCGQVDTIVVGGFQKRKINTFLSALRGYTAADTTYRDRITAYESDFGLCRIVTTRWMPQDTVLLLDSSRVKVLPLAGRSFHFKPLASTGDYECGELIGEYTLELRNEAAHGLIRGLTNS